MKALGASAAAAAMLGLTAQGAFAESLTQSGFRAPAPREFTAADVAGFTVDAETAARMEQYRRDGYQVIALRADQLDGYAAGASNTTWIIVGVVVLVVIVAAAGGGGGGGY